MGWGSIKKSVKGAVNKVPAVKVFKSIKGALKSPKEEEGGTRSEAASQLMKQNVSKQAGGAQINFTEEKYV